MPGQPGRTVVYDAQFELEAAAIQPDARRVDEAMRYLEFVVSQRPQYGLATDYPGVFVAPLNLPRADGTTGSYSVFYTFDDERSYVMSIKEAPGSG